MKVCPMMSRNVAESFDTDNPTLMRIDFQKQECLSKDCALWVVVCRPGDIPTERCGLING